MEPTLSQVIDFIREFTGHRRIPIHEHSWLEADLGVTGDEGVDLLEEIAQAFDVQLYTEEEGYCNTFSLGENQYLFHGEGLDLFGIFRFINWLRGIPEPVVRDLPVGQLHRALVEATRHKGKGSKNAAC
ncbi:Hypothetical protein AKI40_1141 [Enterobacter sp. FY-07]|uniref:hypothetical protein n=1 Tax=Kosakonia oryzendophytica TaxID=1005665 RepID=UPI000777E568|nr:hypothetical protein [Kosakonia oryzendophytica]AMO47561.1 Hypothetical protein AKI40_1141 [Enterobacter sp. FY-07]WBT59277.1 hypothetical protein O9K67_05655 [Kosakonia oryzendophytica]